MQLGSHQKDCISNIDDHFKNNSKGLVKMFCGSGKSFIIYHCLLKYGSNLSVIVVPSINLITQFNRDYMLDNNMMGYNDENFEKEFESLTVCSKNELSNKKSDFTTDEKDISKFLNKKVDKIVLITYQSLKILINVVKKDKLKIDLLCFDEAHHIIGDGMKELLFGTDDEDFDEDFDELNDESNSESETDSDISDVDSDVDSNVSSADKSNNFIDKYVKKTLFFTATPKNSNGIKMYEAVTDIKCFKYYFE